ncbi:MAG: lipoyl synthase [Candidatus Omnitrophica bacterium]|nr:lipoyl synthase [Candidatus Omnitrophota bacterium]
MKKALPSWFRQELPHRETVNILSLLKEFKINTICVSAHCPNINWCFKNKNITFLILGDNCSRRCKFCAVKKGELRGLRDFADEPRKIKEIVKELDLSYAVITSVCRDDLPDKGTGHFRRVVEEIKSYSSQVKIELLIPDFSAEVSLLKEIVDSGAEIIGHNIEMPYRFYKKIKPESDYHCSLKVLKIIKEIKPDIITKSSLLLGFGETEEEVIQVIEDLSIQGVDIFTMGQYLSPSENHYSVREFLSLDKFDFFKEVALKKGIKVVSSGPLVRSSYKAEELYYQILRAN